MQVKYNNHYILEDCDVTGDQKVLKVDCEKYFNLIDDKQKTYCCITKYTSFSFQCYFDVITDDEHRQGCYNNQ